MSQLLRQALAAVVVTLAWGPMCLAQAHVPPGALAQTALALSALPVDHAAPDSAALLVDGGGKRVLYTGDLRSHGRTGYRFERLLSHPPADVDALIIEGTTLSRSDTVPETEAELEVRLTELFRRQADMSLVFGSPQNLDRVVTVFKAARKACRTLVIDLYTAYTLRAQKALSPNIPQPEWEGIAVVPWGYQQHRLKEAGHGSFVTNLKPELIGYEGLVKRRHELVLLARSNATLDRLAERLGPDLSAIQVIWSQWAGYWLDDRHARKLCERHGLARIDAHTSGHASWADLQRLVEALQPKRIIPVHTVCPERYEQRFPNVVRMADGVPVSV